jgi:D-alanyl-D-alanine carboxypeptidase/D-alanyl-D-alanine-endopeptidase (penicillin-binding protein 4)
MKLKILYIFSLLLMPLSIAFAQPKLTSLSKSAQEANNSSNLKFGSWSMYALNSHTGQVLVDINSHKGMAPASNLKLLTSAVALELLGEEYIFNTYLEYDGTISSGGNLNGNLYVRGEGDPTLGSADMTGVLPLDSLIMDWVSRIQNLGIHTISGNLIADDSFLDDYMPTPGTWFWTDMGNYYGAGTSGLCINENLYNLFFKPAVKIGDPAEVLRTEPVIPGLTFINHMKTGPVGSGDNGYIFHAPWQWIQQLEGTIPAGVNEFSIKGSLPDPAKFTVQCLKNKLTEAGITLNGDALTIREAPTASAQRYTFYIVHSPSLKDIIFRLNKKSVNLYAEQILRILGKKYNYSSSVDSSVQVIKNWLTENDISTDGLFLHDGSGLSWLNRITTYSFVQMLVVVSRKPYFQTFYNSLPIAGDSADTGTLKNFCKGTRAAKNLRAKTGGLERVRTHSGYVHSKKGDLICFSMMANDFSGPGKTIESLHEKIMIRLAELP